jgi:hypothetical protein
MVLKPAFLIATLLWASAVAAHSKIYSYVDADGQRHYTDVPDNNRYQDGERRSLRFGIAG